MAVTTHSLERQSMARHRSTVATVARYLGAIAVLGTGLDHVLEFYVNDYRAVPTIGTLFFLNFVSAVVIALGLVVPLRRVAGRFAHPIRALFALGGIGLGLGSLAGLFISESTSLFGFMENGYRTGIVLAIVAEVAAVLLLTVYLAAAGTGTEELRRRDN
jgi:hypothetical protein